VTADQQPRTAAQHDWDNQQGDFHTIWHGSPVDRTIWKRTQELSAEIAALRDTVAALQSMQTFDQSNNGTALDGLDKRIRALEYQRDRAEADADDLLQIRARVLPQKSALESPGGADRVHSTCICEDRFGELCDGTCCMPRIAEAAPELDPLCQKCGYRYVDHHGPAPVGCRGYFPQADPATAHDGSFEGSFGGQNAYQEWVESAHQEPLDPVLVAMQTLYELLLPSESHYDAMYLTSDLRREWRIRTDREEANAREIDSAIRSYGRDGAR